ncbi:MAG: hypothetical protein ABIJ20_00440 [Nanoarchaeota archaeon]|nr:hypothetical protein [Nanoarchaeota archaeon]MBU1445375.1 hypothetical protein [Nanoarchaeota archaeon]MBU2420148.1 hypothetical protein [Nanoarchaeota archaeon]MBU2475277.1 hypothetical protein [Nanoarchaeota archaeon]
MKGDKIFWFNGIGQLLLVIGVYLTLIFKNTVGLVLLGVSFVLFLLYYLLKGDTIVSDEMIDALSYKSNRFALTAVVITIVLLTVASLYLTMTAINVLMIIFSVFIISTIACQVYLFLGLGKKE